MTGPERTGVVLAGGRSRRFGDRDKALVEIEGEPMVARVVRRLSGTVDRIVVGCRADQRAAIERALRDADAESVPTGPDPERSDPIADARAAPGFGGTPVGFALDESPDGGPLAGVRDAFATVDADYAAVVACDLPGVDPDLVEHLFDRSEGRDAAVPEDAEGYVQPALAVYRVDATREAAERLLAADRRSLRAALEVLDVVIVPADVVAEHTGPRSLLDVDSVADLEAFLEAPSEPVEGAQHDRSGPERRQRGADGSESGGEPESGEE